MALASFIIFYFHSYDLLAWAVILFFSRIGASLVEIMRETYFFKKVDAKDIQLINALRSITPISYIIAPLAVGLILSFLQIEYVFLFLGLIILLGLYPALTLKDTK
jgi:MFS family permease